MTSKKKALVTGACGFTGGHMIELLLKEGWEVTATDLKREEHKKYYCEEGILHPVYYEEVIEKLGVEFIPADLTKKETLVPLFEGRPPYDAIFHIASLYDYFAEMDILYRVNVIGAKNLAELALEYKAKRFIHWSTEGVYGEAEDKPIEEDHPHNPPNNYSKSKSEQEKVLWQLYKERGLPLTILRPAPIYGPRHRYGVYHILYGIRRIGTGFVISWYPKRKTLMFPSVHVIDLVRAALFVAEKEEAIGNAYNVLSECISQTELLEFLYDALGVKRVIRIPVWWHFYKLCASIALKVIIALDRRARKKGMRPKVDVPMAGYLTHQYWFSNKKLKELGFKYIYEDPRKGLWDYITWCKERGWL